MKEKIVILALLLCLFIGLGLSSVVYDNTYFPRISKETVAEKWGNIYNGTVFKEANLVVKELYL